MAKVLASRHRPDKRNRGRGKCHRCHPLGLRAVESAVANAKSTLIYDHVNHCLDPSASNPSAASRRALEDFKANSRYLQGACGV